MIAKILIDNIAPEGFIAEWGLAVWIEHGQKRILLDTGTTGIFTQNAQKMGVNLADADAGVLSHAHYDHANGMEAFFDLNPCVKFYLRAGTKERCYGKKEGKYRYNGIQKGLLKRHAGRIVYADGNYELMPGAYLIPHSTPGLQKIAARSNLYVRRGLRMVPDDFSHEQSLVLETEKGLVIFNSCSHAGPDNIISEVTAAFPGKKIHTLIGGLHLFKLSDDEVRQIAAAIRKTGIEQVYTGHCTGERGYEVLREELGDGVRQIQTGMVIEV